MLEDLSLKASGSNPVVGYIFQVTKSPLMTTFIILLGKYIHVCEMHKSQLVLCACRRCAWTIEKLVFT